MKSIKTLAVLVIFGALVVWAIAAFINIGNSEVDIRNRFGQKRNERMAMYDKLVKIISQKAQVAVQNDSSFRRNVDLIMTGRKDGENVMFKMITESNPNANYAEVSALYKDLSRSIEAERDGFFELEKEISDIKREHDNMLDKFPSSIILSLLGRTRLDYTPITSDRTINADKTGKDNDTKVF